MTLMKEEMTLAISMMKVNSSLDDDAQRKSNATKLKPLRPRQLMLMLMPMLMVMKAMILFLLSMRFKHVRQVPFAVRLVNERRRPG